MNRKRTIEVTQFGRTDIEGPQLGRKYQLAQEAVRRLGRVAVAFSGGVDSTFILKLAVDTLGRDNVLAVTADSPSLARREAKDARELAELIGARHVIIDPREFDDANYLANPANRCYYCKTALYDAMAARLDEWGMAAIVNGTNDDDLGDWRPGLKAAAEHRVHSPCVEAGLTKDEIRRLSAALGLPTHDKPAAPCLSSRIPYGQPVTLEKLRMIEQAEAALHALGFRECRVRHYEHVAGTLRVPSAASQVLSTPASFSHRAPGDGTRSVPATLPLARVELPPARLEELKNPTLHAAIEDLLREIGYRSIEIDPRGLRSGSLNEMLTIGRL